MSEELAERRRIAYGGGNSVRRSALYVLNEKVCLGAGAGLRTGKGCAASPMRIRRPLGCTHVSSSGGSVSGTHRPPDESSTSFFKLGVAGVNLETLVIFVRGTYRGSHSPIASRIWAAVMRLPQYASVPVLGTRICTAYSDWTP